MDSLSLHLPQEEADLHCLGNEIRRFNDLSDIDLSRFCKNGEEVLCVKDPTDVVHFSSVHRVTRKLFLFDQGDDFLDRFISLDHHHLRIRNHYLFYGHVREFENALEDLFLRGLKDAILSTFFDHHLHFLFRNVSPLGEEFLAEWLEYEAGAEGKDFNEDGGNLRKSVDRSCCPESDGFRMHQCNRLGHQFPKDHGEIGDYNGYDDLQQYIPDSFVRWDYLSKAQYLEMLIFLSNYLLSSQGDRVAMAHGVEVRLPYLDHRLIEFMGHVPSRFKINVLVEKHILKEMFRQILPESILYRPKQPYRAPIRESLLPGNYIQTDKLLSEYSLLSTTLFDIDRVRRLLDKLMKNQQVSEGDNMAIAGIISAQIVYDQFISHFPMEPLRSMHHNLIIDRRSHKKFL